MGENEKHGILSGTRGKIRQESIYGTYCPGVGIAVPPERRKDREGGTAMPRLVIVVFPLKKMERGSYSLDRGQI